MVWHGESEWDSSRPQNTNLYATRPGKVWCAIVYILTVSSVGLRAQARILLPDRKGGFFCMEGYLESGYVPRRLLHYREDGQYDRKLTLAGSKVVVQPCASVIDPDGGLCTLYGSAVANSRKVYTVFAMEIDENLNVSRLDVRKIDAESAVHSDFLINGYNDLDRRMR